MAPAPQKDHTQRGVIASLALIAVLAGVSFIPPQTLGGVHLRRANIFSDLASFDDAAVARAQPELIDGADFHVDLARVAEQIEAIRIEMDTVARTVETTFEWRFSEHIRTSRQVVLDSTRTKPLVAIEDFAPADSSRLQAFYDTLLHAQRPVRIAVLGDSFIEGDIMTADLREQLQTAYGGGGVGFAPMASPLTAFRRTIKTQSKGWTSYNIMQRKTAPEALRANFYVSGWVCRPATGASTRWGNSDFRRKAADCTTARVLFISPADSRIELTLNDSLRREFPVEGASAVRQAVVHAPNIGSLTFKVLSGAEEFIGYGAVFESEGVVVDNYSVRSNNGQAMFWTNPSVNAQIDALAPYDLVILQYGLNIMQEGVSSYGNYADQIEQMVAYVRECFPSAAVLVLGVSERSMRTDAGFEPMDAIPHMLRYQRRAAENSGAAFWSTGEAMRAMGGIEHFVANGWAGKDYTHINFAGGRRIANALFEAIDAGARATKERIEAARIRREEQQQLLDSLRIGQIEAQLSGTTTPKEVDFKQVLKISR